MSVFLKVYARDFRLQPKEHFKQLSTPQQNADRVYEFSILFVLSLLFSEFYVTKAMGD